MGTISDKLLHLNNIKAAIKEAINAQPNGPFIEAGDTFRSYETAVLTSGVSRTISAANEAAWYVLSPANMFTDRAGTDLVDAADDFVGLMMDSSKGQELGVDINSDPDFNDAAQWVVPAECSISSGVLTVTNPTAIRAARDASSTAISVASKRYKFSFVINSNTGLEVCLYAGGTAFNAGTLPAGTYDYTIAANTSAQFLGLGAFAGTGVLVCESFSVQEVAGNHLQAVIDAGRALYKTDGTDDWFQLDKVDDNYSTTFASPIVGTMLIGTRKGTIHLEVDIPAGAWSLTPNAAYFPGNTVTDIIIKDGYMTTAELANAKAWLASRGSPLVYTPTGTDLNNAFRLRTDVTSLVTDSWVTGNATRFDGLVQNSTTITTMDITTLDFSASNNNQLMFYLCSSLSSLIVGNAFDNCPTNKYANAFTGCALDQPTVDSILHSVRTAFETLMLSGGYLTINGGTNATPSAAGQADADYLRAAGMTVALNGY